MEKTISQGPIFGEPGSFTHEIIVSFKGAVNKVTSADLKIMRERFDDVFKEMRIGSNISRTISLDEIGGAAIAHILYSVTYATDFHPDDRGLIKADIDSTISRLEVMLTVLLD